MALTAPNDQPPVGVVLIQLGTPDSTAVGDVRRYLREFLSDPRVMDLPAPARKLILNLVILPFRPRRSAEQYGKIWTEDGSPLLIHTNDLAAAVQERLGPSFHVTVGMRYQNPPLSDALDELATLGCTRVIAVPLFPQYASAAYGSAAAHALELAARRWNVPAISTVAPFFDNQGFLDSAGSIARPLIDDFAPDHVLFSYHGVPESQIHKGASSGSCPIDEECCSNLTAANQFCYRAQCYATTAGLARSLGLPHDGYTTTFQSRMKGKKWIEPFTDILVNDLYDQGVRRLAVLTPSFVADCLETTEEIGIRLREQWEGIGGEDLLLVPCVNSAPEWASALTQMIRETA